MKKKAKNKKKIVAKRPASKSSGKKHAPTISNTTGVQPLADRVLVKPLSPHETGRTLASGIIIPETADKEKPEQGTVVTVGPGKRSEDGKLVPPSVKVGDKVMFSKYGYDELKVGGVEYYIVNENNILAVINH